MDFLWLLAASEIVTAGSTGRYGLAPSSEGEQYKYYQEAIASSSIGLQEAVTKDGSDWLLRSHYWKNKSYATYASNMSGVAGTVLSNGVKDVAPGFCI